MDGMEDKIGAILNNPQMMQQIMAMAQSLGAQSPPEEKPPEPPQSPPFDMGMVQRLAGLSRQSAIDSQQQNLLKALSPYLSRERIHKLEKAMRAAKMAKFASAALGQR